MPAPIAGVDGAWGCPGCQNVNFATREACNRCQGPKPEDAGQQQWAMQGQQFGGGKGGRPAAGVDGNWACGQCQNVNFATRDACNRCQTPRAQAEVAADPSQFGGGGKGGRPMAGVDGNWACPSCQNVNFATRMACNRCQQPKADAGYGMAASGQRSGGGPQAGVDGNWACPSCQNVNFATRMACNRCQAPKPAWAGGGGGGGGRGGPQAGVDGNWACPGCQNVNFATRTACNRCQTPKPEDQFGGGGFGASTYTPSGAPVAGASGNWKCSQCQNVNFASREACNRCQAARSEAEAPLPAGGFGGFGGGGGGKGRPVAGENGNWGCPGCGNVNFATREVCNRCQGPKPEEEAAASESVWGALIQPEDFAGDQPAKRMKF